MTDEFRERLANGETLDDLLARGVRHGPRGGQSGPWASAISTSRSWAVPRCMAGTSPRCAPVRARPWSRTLPAYLNALTGKGVHVVTVNDYLAKRDAEWMGRVHRFLGLEVGVILAQMTPEERRKQYAADITYGTNNEFGFDYLRDNMAWSLEECVQRGHTFAIVDEVDSILIDEARTPLIISGPAEQSARSYTEFAKIAPRLRKSEEERRRRLRGRREEAHRGRDGVRVEKVEDGSASTTSTSRSTRRWSASSTTPSRRRNCTSWTRTTS